MSISMYIYISCIFILSSACSRLADKMIINGNNLSCSFQIHHYAKTHEHTQNMRKLLLYDSIFAIINLR